MTNQTQWISRKKQQQQKKDAERPTWQRVGGLLLSLALAVGGLIMVLVGSVQTAEGTGLVGVRGTFTIDFCTSEGSGKSRHHNCYGDFVAHGDSPADKVSGRLDNGDDYASNTKIAAVKDIVRGGDHYRETGIGETALSLFTTMGPSLLLLALGIHWTRKWARALRT